MKTIVTALFILGISLFSTPTAFAAVDDGIGEEVHRGDVCDPRSGVIDLGRCLRLSDGQSVKDVYDTPSKLVNLIVSNLFVIAGVILFILVIYSGFQFIAGSTKGQEQAKTVMTTAIAGFLLMFTAYWIVQIIEAVIGQQILL